MRYTSESFIACISGYKGEKARGDGGGGGGSGKGSIPVSTVLRKSVRNTGEATLES